MLLLYKSETSRNQNMGDAIVIAKFYLTVMESY